MKIQSYIDRAGMQDELEKELNYLQSLFDDLDILKKELKKTFKKEKYTKFAKMNTQLGVIIKNFKESVIFREYSYHKECKHLLPFFNTQFL